MEKKFIHIKLPNDFFECDNNEQLGLVEVLRSLQAKVEEHGEPGQYCCFATPFDVKCLNDNEVLITIENLLSTVFIQEHLRDGLKSLFDRVIKQVEGKPSESVKPAAVKIPFDTFKGPICKGDFTLGSACGHCEKCEWLKANTRIECRHKKVYAVYTLESYPQQYPWICATCGEKGTDTEKVYTRGIPEVSYEELIKKTDW